jgi:hypothetical protein
MRLTSPQQSDGGRAERTGEKFHRGIIGPQRAKPLLSLRHIVLVQQRVLTTREGDEVRNFNTQFVASIIGSATWPPSAPRKLSGSIPVEVETRGRPRHP